MDNDYTVAELLRRGWTPAMIRKVLEKEPLHYRGFGSFSRSAILKVERSQRFEKRLRQLRRQVLEEQVDPNNEPGRELRWALVGGKLTRNQENRLSTMTLGPAASILFHRAKRVG